MKDFQSVWTCIGALPREREIYLNEVSRTPEVEHRTTVEAPGGLMKKLELRFVFHHKTVDCL